MNCDSIARWYRWLEYGAFGHALQARRERFLPDVQDARHVLVLGDGDGRALEALLRWAPSARIDYVDSSGQMLRLARLRGGAERVNYYCADALDVDFQSLRSPQTQTGHTGAIYDVIVTHFFLDCLNPQQIARLTAHLEAVTGPETRWIVSEFQESGFASRLLIRALYLFFRITTGLQAGRLPDHEFAFRRAGFQRSHTDQGLGGLLISELWVKSTTGSAGSDAGAAKLDSTAPAAKSHEPPGKLTIGDRH